MELSLHLRVGLFAAALVAPVAAQAENAFYLKGGFSRITDNTQTLDSQARKLDTVSTGTYGMLFEHRTQRDIAFGVEYFNYRNDFLPPNTTGAGVATTRSVQFVVKKYLGQDVFHPFFGLGVGVARTTVDYGGGAWNDEDVGLAMQATLGLELRFHEMGLMFEAKRLVYDMDNIFNSSSSYNPSAIALFASIGFNW